MNQYQTDIWSWQISNQTNMSAHCDCKRKIKIMEHAMRPLKNWAARRWNQLKCTMKEWHNEVDVKLGQQMNNPQKYSRRVQEHRGFGHWYQFRFKSNSVTMNFIWTQNIYNGGLITWMHAISTKFEGLKQPYITNAVHQFLHKISSK